MIKDGHKEKECWLSGKEGGWRWRGETKIRRIGNLKEGGGAGGK